MTVAAWTQSDRTGLHRTTCGGGEGQAAGEEEEEEEEEAADENTKKEMVQQRELISSSKNQANTFALGCQSRARRNGDESGAVCDMCTHL
jgi:hypothetical protein